MEKTLATVPQETHGKERTRRRITPNQKRKIGRKIKL